MTNPELQKFTEQIAADRMPVAIVLGACVNALSYVRSLGRKGVPVLLLNGTRGVASRSRFGTLCAGMGEAISTVGAFGWRGGSGVTCLREISFDLVEIWATDGNRG